jgi:hypothetical protein
MPGWGVLKEPHITIKKERFVVQRLNKEYRIARHFYSLERAIQFREWLYSGEGQSCRTTQDTYTHKDGALWLLG